MLPVIENALIFFPTKALHATPAYISLHYEDVTIATTDGQQLHGWWVPTDNATAVVALFHGNAGNISDRVHLVQLLHGLRVTTFLFDYRGYGNSTGDPSEAGMYEDARSAVSWLLNERQVPVEKLILFGRSLGGAAAIEAASTISPAGVILEGAFTSARDMARTMPLGFLLQYFLRTRLDNLDKIASLTAPLLCMHGTRDTVVPYELGERLYQQAPEPKQWYPVQGADHNDTQQIGGAGYANALKDFIRQVCPGG